MYCKNYFWEEKNRVGSLASHIAILDYESEEILSAGKLGKVLSWYKNMVICVQTHRDHSITWIGFYN